MNFLWGVSTAGHQVEGDNTNSDTWFAEHVSPTVFREPSGPACRNYERWADDIALVAELGLTAYRFSVEWARVEPVEGSFSDEALGHYEAMVDRCHELGLTPVVTFNHFTAPHWFAARGGWLDPQAPELFARYCDRVAARFGDRIGMAVTLNEPNLPRLLSWMDLPSFIRDLEKATLAAAAEKAGVERYRLANVVMLEDLDAIEDGFAAGHVAGRDAIRARCPELPVGVSLAMVDDVVAGDDASVRDRKRAQVYGRWLELASADEFVGVQNYECIAYDGTGAVPPPDGAPQNQMHSAIEPESLAGAVRYAYSVAGVPILVTEHGLATEDDDLRGPFIEASLAGLAEAVRDGVPVLGYLHWTLLDNFEWIFGYGMQYGLCSVDRETFERTIKPSARRYAEMVRAQRH